MSSGQSVNQRSGPESGGQVSRRDMLRSAAALSAATAAGLVGCNATRAQGNPSPEEGSAVQHGRIKQDLISWTYMGFGAEWDLETLCQVSRDLGCHGVELLGPADFPTLEQYGLICPMANNGMPDPPFMKGLNNPRYQEEVIARTVERIEACAAAGMPAVIAFTGYKYRDAEDPESGEISLEEGADNTVEGLKELARHAEEHGVNVCLEHLNSRVEGDDYRGHPGYQGDDIDYCADIIRRVGSPNVKLVFDIYHVQIMNGDVIARIREYGTDLIGHIHTAGVPGRGELDETQELQYKPIMEALLEIGYDGYVGQEFIPTRDPMAGLREAVALCDV